jgi:PAS domain S-box-containing protein
MLYHDRRVDPDNPNEIRDILEKEGYHVGFAKGKKLDGDEIPLEIVTGNIPGKQGAVLLIRDITKRKLIQDKLDESEERYHILFEGSKGAICVTQENMIIDANFAWLKMHGYVNKEEVLGKDLIDYVHPDDRETFETRRMNWEATQSGAYRMRELHKDGHDFVVELHSGIINLDGKEAIITTVRKVREKDS